jgi:3-mercaptopyruvate sulfurtransferase SseA
MNMVNAMKYFFLLSLAGCLLFFCAQPSRAAEGTTGNLVNVNWLETNRKSADVLILDASAAQTYAAKHIPGAVSVDLFAWYGLKEMPVADMERLIQSWGISPGRKIVMYDPGGTFLATRLFYSLYYFGFPAKDLLILDGGLSKWQQAGLPVTKDVTPAQKKGSFTIKTVNEDVRVRLPEVLAASGDSSNRVLLEALGADWHFGQVVAFDRAGHIPNGVLLPSADLYNPDKTFKSPEDIETMLKYLGIRPDQEISTYCGGGVAASAPFFALKFIVNYPKVKLFTESEMGWLSDERGLPYWTYDAPLLMREAQWLQSWGGQMMRTYGGSRVSIVDVRPAEAFNQGHVPFALNVPADVFRSHIAHPETLADILGAAGVNASDEAVVLSGAALTRESALAFVMLEKLGQKKVSVFMDSMETWTTRGFAVKKDSTVVAATYPAHVRADVMIADPASTQGSFPKIFIASGTDVPANAPDGTVVHVPYSDLLNADGTPRAAKDIWNILTKAGVPRYAELVCFSDDPGEAAVNYFVLKLMGYPDIKVFAPLVVHDRRSQK